MSRKDFLRWMIFKGLLWSVLFFLPGIGKSFAQTKKAPKKKAAKNTKSKKNKRKSRKSRSRRKNSRRRRFTYKRGGPDIRAITKDSTFSDVPDNGITPVEEPFKANNLP